MQTKMNQKNVKLIGLRVENSGIIKAAELTPDLLSKKLIRVQGSMGNGKSTLLDAWKTAISGTDAIRKKDVLENGYLAEAQLVDGDLPIFVGAKVREKRNGESELETFLYTKDANGKIVNKPIIDGVSATAASYMSLLTTELTFDMPSLFSENQSAHRKLIEKLFKPELDKLGADEVAEKILTLKKQRDNARAMADAIGAKMTIFEEEGWKKEKLDMLEKVDISQVSEQITQKKIERDRIVNGTEDAFNLAVEKLKAERQAELQKIKDEGAKVREAMRVSLEKSQKEYDEMTAYNVGITNLKDSITDSYHAIQKSIVDLVGADDNCDLILKELLDAVNRRLNSIIPAECIKPEPDPEMSARLNQLLASYATLEATPLATPDRIGVDTTEIDTAIAALEAKQKSAEATNAIFNRYQIWQSWIEADGLYQKEVDVLRKMYASINTGVEGMSIVPRETESGRIEVWIMYNGCYDPKFFGNQDQEMRFLFGGDKGYSSFQRSIIGLMLQATRLNLRPKALRLAFLDDVAFDTSGVAILADIAEKLDLQLVVAWTHEFDKEAIEDGQVIVDGGEIFFDSKN